MYTYTITIGRNYGTIARTELQGQPMSDQMWAEFEDKVNELVARFVYGDGAVEVHHGVGVWDGVAEESTVTTLRIRDSLTAGAVTALRGRLRNLADIYGQDAIALTIGQSELVVNSFTNVVNA